ncbi:MAG: dxs [Acidimicrobiales bacterium]|nr:dxs [Acidimicrobiales bacterium]
MTILERTNAPADLKGFSYDELDVLATEIRELIVDSVNRFGGHMGSNLGAVELTLALHRVFESPRDILLWDTGHQAYAHKIVTGRQAGFESLRQPGGMSGYPSRAESEHDWVENSHASTILSYAHGLGSARTEAPEDRRRVVAVIGDGSMTGGMAFEGLNNLGNTGTDCVIVLNDNGRSYAPTASRLGTGLRRLPPRSAPAAGTDDLGDCPAGAEPADHPEFFETLGIGYAGPVDGHDIPALEAALAAAAERPGPQLVHVLTRKGSGYGPAEDDPVKRLHDTSFAKPGSFTIGFGHALVELAAEDHRLVAITAGMPDSTGLLPFADRFPERFFDVGIAEQHAVGSAAGMAMGGLVPVVAIYSTFLTRAVDQLVYDVGLHGVPVIFCIDRAGITGDDGPSHHGVLDMVVMSKVPGMTMFAPSSYEELAVMLRDAVAIATGPEPGPVSIRWSKTVPPTAPGGVTGRGTQARQLAEGDDLCIIAVGKTLEAATAAAATLEAEGISVTVWDPRCVKPLDPAMLDDAARHPYVVTVEDGLREGGIGSAIRDSLAESTMLSDHAPRVRVLGTPCAFIDHGNPDALLAQLGLDAVGIAAVGRELAQSGAPRTVRSLDTVGVL